MSSHEKLVWDYKSGSVIDAETGEVVDTIYAASKYDGLRGRELADRVHYSPLSGYRFEATDEVAEQIKQLKLSPTWRETYAYLKLQSADSRKNEKGLLDVYTLSMNVLSRLVGVVKAADLVERVVRDAYGVDPAAKKCVLAAAAVYTVARVLGAPVDMYDVGRELGLDTVSIGRAARIAIRLSGKYKCDRVEVVSRLIDRASSELKHPQLSVAAKALLRRCADVLSGKTSKAVAGGLLYLSSILINAGVHASAVSRAVGGSEVATCSTARKIAKRLGIEVRRSPAYVVTSVTAPQEICRELESVDIKLADYVTCR